MKKLVFSIFFLLVISTNAQVNVDSVINAKRIGVFEVKDTLERDTINIKSIVEQQILAAKIKMQKETKENNVNTDPYKLNVSEVPNYKPKKTLLEIFLNLSFEVKIFLVFSVLLLSFVGIRRIVLKFQRKEILALKNKIKLLREEKIPDKLIDKKTKSRRELVHNLPIKKVSEKHITKKAKELKISKGELLLAARLKYLEYERM